MVERQARDLEVLSSNPGPGSNFSLEFKNKELHSFYLSPNTLRIITHNKFNLAGYVARIK